MERFAHSFAAVAAVFGLGVAALAGGVMTVNAALALNAALGGPQPAALALADSSNTSHTQLTQEQQQAIISLLKSFNVDQGTITQVTAVLNGTGGEGGGRGALPPQANGRPFSAVASSSVGTLPPGRVISTLARLRPCPTSTQILTRGSQGSDVEDLQNFLADQGFLNASSSTGYFGPLTEQALQHWQMQNGVVTSGTPGTTGFGVFGPKTREALGKACGFELGDHPPGPNAPPPPPPPTASSSSATTTVSYDTPGASNDDMAAAVEFMADYSDAFNQNLVAVVAAPFQILTYGLTDYFVSLGVR